jgi:predicted CoA-binding protein
MEPLNSPLEWVKPYRCGPTLCYLVAGGLLIDAHARIAEAKLAPKQIFLTHEHWDHCAGIDQFKCEIFASEEAAKAINSKDDERMRFSAHEVPMVKRKVSAIKEGETIRAGGFELEVIYAAGHTSGSAMLFHRASGTLFSGDAVFANSSIPRHDLPGGSLPGLISTYEKLSQLEISWVFPGHGLIFRNNGSILRTLTILKERLGNEDTGAILKVNIHDHKTKNILVGAKTIAVVGLSRDEKKPGRQIAEYLRAVGYKIIPVNSAGGEFFGKKAYPTFRAIPGSEKIDIVCVFIPASNATVELAKEAALRKVKVFWMQPGAESAKAETEALSRRLDVVMGDCIMQEHRRLIKRAELGQDQSYV